MGNKIGGRKRKLENGAVARTMFEIDNSAGFAYGALFNEDIASRHVLVSHICAHVFNGNNSVYVMEDGSTEIVVHDPETHEITKVVAVGRDGKVKVDGRAVRPAVPKR